MTRFLNPPFEMTTPPKGPYLQFNFLVDLDDTRSRGPHAGFQECSNLALESTHPDYRSGSERENRGRKVPGLKKSTEVTLKRGLIGSSHFQQWLNDIRAGNQNALRNVVIHLQNEDHTANVQTWKLRRARLVKHVSGRLNAKGTDVAMEELTLAYERLEIS
jgi:phage tail-like protein